MNLYCITNNDSQSQPARRFALREDLLERVLKQEEALALAWKEHPSFNWLNYEDSRDWILIATSCLTVLFEEIACDSPFERLRVTLGACEKGDFPSYSFGGFWPICVQPAQVSGVQFLISILEHWAYNCGIAEVPTEIGFLEESREPSVALLSRVESLLKFLPSAPAYLLNQTSAETLEFIEGQWAPTFGTYCWHCAHLSTRLFAEAHFEGCCPSCQSILQFELRLPPTHMLEAEFAGNPPARPWFGDLSGLASSAERRKIKSVRSVRVQFAQLVRVTGPYGSKTHYAIGLFPEHGDEIEQLMETVQPHGWSIKVSAVAAKIAVTAEVLRRRTGLLWLPSPEESELALEGFSLVEAARLLASEEALAISSTVNANSFLS